MIKMTRRNFIGTLGALAALAVYPGTAKVLTESDRAKFVRLAVERGLITDQEFIITDGRPLVIDAPNVHIHRCRFVWTQSPGDHAIYVTKRGQQGFQLHGAYLDCGGAGCGIRFEQDDRFYLSNVVIKGKGA